MHASVDAIPFVMGFLATLVQPALDLLWMSRYEKLYHAEDQALVGGAKWIADISAFLPTALLTLFGTVLILDTASAGQRPWFLLTGGVLGAATAVIYVLTMMKRDPENKTRTLYSFPQYWLMALNLAGAAAACAIK